MMKHIKPLRDFIKETLRKDLSEYDNSADTIGNEQQADLAQDVTDLMDTSIYIILEIDKDEFDSLKILYEGKWKPSNIKDFWQRVDTPSFDFEKRHIHITYKKHIKTKSKQVSWNDDGTRHDNKTFDDNFIGIETAKEIARNVLKIPEDKIIEFYNLKDEMSLILEHLEKDLPKITFLKIK